jgi:phosphogluconate dehydratase
VRVDAVAGTLDVLTPGVLDRPIVHPDFSANEFGTGRELFALFRRSVSASTEGAGVLA